MLIDVAFLWQHLLLISAIVLMTAIGKTAIISGICLLFGVDRLSTALTVGICLSQIGEFAFVLLTDGLHARVISKTMYLLLLHATAMSLFATPLLFVIAEMVQQRARFGNSSRSSNSIGSKDCMSRSQHRDNSGDGQRLSADDIGVAFIDDSIEIDDGSESDLQQLVLGRRRVSHGKYYENGGT